MMVALRVLLLAPFTETATRERCDPTSVGSEACEPCPRGKYRPANSNGVMTGSQRRECEFCPRGRYGETAGLTASMCTAQCPAGRYSESIGARTVDDCKLCPPGRYGAISGLTSRACTDACPSGRSSSSFGLTAPSQCTVCPDGLRAWQCEDVLVPQKGFFDPESNDINEESHAYIIDNEDIPEGRSPVAFETWDPIHKTYDPALENEIQPANSIDDYHDHKSR